MVLRLGRHAPANQCRYPVGTKVHYQRGAEGIVCRVAKTDVRRRMDGTGWERWYTVCKRSRTTGRIVWAMVATHDDLREVET